MPHTAHCMPLAAHCLPHAACRLPHAARIKKQVLVPQFSAATQKMVEQIDGSFAKTRRGGASGGASGGADGASPADMQRQIAGMQAQIQTLMGRYSTGCGAVRCGAHVIFART